MTTQSTIAALATPQEILTLTHDCPQLALLIPGLPLLAAALVAWRCLNGASRQGGKAEPLTVALSSGMALGVLLMLLVLDALALAYGAPGALHSGEWFHLGTANNSARISLHFLLDATGLRFATLVSLIGWITLRFSANYLHREAGFHRFYLGMNLFLGGMLLIVLAGNALLAFVGWELVGFASWLLIGFTQERPTATGNALFAFVTNRIGDAGFLLSIGLAYWWLGSVEWHLISGQGQIEALPTLTARLLVFGFVLAALAKSAQLPLTPWIARALEGPTPSSAIFYGAVMVHAGVFLLIRLEPLLRQVPDILVLLALVGGLTALYGAFCALVQSDVKSALVYATVTQVGLMVLACGLGYFELAGWHLVLHSAFRAWQFLNAPSYMHLVQGPARPVSRWLARQQWLYIAALRGFWIETLAVGLLVQPSLALGRDMQHLEESVIDHALTADPAEDATAPALPRLLAAYGLAGQGLYWLAGHLQRLENRLVLAQGGGAIATLLRQMARALLIIDSFIEQPRYLMLMVMATFVVIL